ncbi:MAG: PRC-barrel domain-containing protein [Alphaproteobacteria bacterium]|nr:PRC-barrel domain-containing protein [Alphaproteobacteria bacterium]MCD8520367.1 PRC-barrel domain-containing protein [Alphaproteobacteria bacterium]MCD8526056.1 PRC-barrel domain-containing protein [Alphaproteobacteria bacterium]MCD8571603.1 PRC-barrel domain-containing protein [Alphaproteobacteria bacterium]
MSLYRIMLVLVGLALLAGVNVATAAETDPEFAFKLGEYNRVNPKQSELFTRASRVMSGDLYDANNKAVGDIDDVLIAREGNIYGVQTSLDRIIPGGPSLTLSFSVMDMNAVTGGYRMNQTAKDLEAAYPNLFASIETASGPDSGVLSVRSLINADVKAENGVKIGKVEDVIFESDSSRVHSLMVRVNYKTIRGKSVAVPIDAPKYTEGSYGRPDVILTNVEADTLLEFAY